MKISKQLDVNIRELEKQFTDCSDIIHRPLVAAGRTVYVVYVDSLIDRDLVEGEFLKNMMYGVDRIPDTNVFDFIQKQVITTADTKAADTIWDAVLGEHGAFYFRVQPGADYFQPEVSGTGCSECGIRGLCPGTKGQLYRVYADQYAARAPAHPGYTAEDHSEENRRPVSDGYNDYVYGRDRPPGDCPGYPGTAGQL